MPWFDEPHSGTVDKSEDSKPRPPAAIVDGHDDHHQRRRDSRTEVGDRRRARRRHRMLVPFGTARIARDGSRTRRRHRRSCWCTARGRMRRAGTTSSATLQRRGYTVLAPANPLRGLASDSDYLASILSTLDGPLILVGHSYGGMVMTNAATGNPNVKALVYIAAFAPDAGRHARRARRDEPGQPTHTRQPDVPPLPRRRRHLHLTTAPSARSSPLMSAPERPPRWQPGNARSRRRSWENRRDRRRGRPSTRGISSAHGTTPSRRRHSDSWPSGPAPSPLRSDRHTPCRSPTLTQWSISSSGRRDPPADSARTLARLGGSNGQEERNG